MLHFDHFGHLTKMVPMQFQHFLLCIYFCSAPPCKCTECIKLLILRRPLQYLSTHPGENFGAEFCLTMTNITNINFQEPSNILLIRFELLDYLVKSIHYNYRLTFGLILQYGRVYSYCGPSWYNFQQSGDIRLLQNSKGCTFYLRKQCQSRPWIVN